MACAAEPSGRCLHLLPALRYVTGLLILRTFSMVVCHAKYKKAVAKGFNQASTWAPWLCSCSRCHASSSAFATASRRLRRRSLPAAKTAVSASSYAASAAGRTHAASSGTWDAYVHVPAPRQPSWHGSSVPRYEVFVIDCDVPTLDADAAQSDALRAIFNSRCREGS